MRRLNRVEKPSIKSSTFTDISHTGQIHAHLNIQVSCVMAITRLVSSQRRNQFEIISLQVRRTKKERGSTHGRCCASMETKTHSREKRFGLRFSGTAWKIKKKKIKYCKQSIPPPPLLILKVFHPTAVPPHFLSSTREAVELVVAFIFLFSILFLFLLGHFYEPVPPTHFHPTTFYLKVSNLFSSSPLKWIEDEKIEEWIE